MHWIFFEKTIHQEGATYFGKINFIDNKADSSSVNEYYYLNNQRI